jgi:hypothetical protein
MTPGSIVYRSHFSSLHRVRINPPHPLASRKRRFNGGGLSDEIGKTEAQCHSGSGTKDRVPSIAKCRPNFGGVFM